jgi:hypothetical protein
MRKTPYTEIGIRRVKCFRCNAPARFQWTICSLGSRFAPVCEQCDVALNELVLRFMGVIDFKDIIKQYAKEKGVDYVADYNIENVPIENWHKAIKLINKNYEYLH